MPKKRDMNAPYWQQLREAERRIIEYALEHGGSLRATAAILGISSNYLSERTRELGIPTPEVRPGPKPGAKRPNLRVVPPDGPVTDPTADADAPATPKPPKPPKRPAASTEETLDEDVDDEDEDEDEEWEDPDEDGEEDSDDDEDDEDDDENNGGGSVEDASQGGN